MFEKLIRDETKVNIYYGNEQTFISGVITEYFEEYDLIRIYTQGIILPIKCITKIEILEDPPAFALLAEQQELIHDVDFDNARYMEMTVSVWKNGERIHPPDELVWHNEDYVQIGQSLFDKHAHTFILETKHNAKTSSS